MGMVTRELEFRDREELSDYLKMEYDVELLDGENTLKEIELNTVLVNAEIVEMKSEVVLRLKKLVSLKAFLLSAEANMDINKLLFDIDTLMRMSEEGLSRRKDGIADDDSLDEFFKAAGIVKLDDCGNLKDSKRTVKVEYKGGYYDFNSIVEI